MGLTTVNKQANKVDMVRFISKKTDIPQVKVNKMVDAMMQHISDCLCKKQSVVLWGIGTLKPKIRDTQTFYNIHTQQKEQSEPARTVGFTLSDTLKKKIVKQAPITNKEREMLEAERAKNASA